METNEGDNEKINDDRIRIVQGVYPIQSYDRYFTEKLALRRMFSQCVMCFHGNAFQGVPH